MKWGATKDWILLSKRFLAVCQEGYTRTPGWARRPLALLLPLLLTIFTENLIFYILRHLSTWKFNETISSSKNWKTDKALGWFYEACTLGFLKPQVGAGSSLVLGHWSLLRARKTVDPEGLGEHKGRNKWGSTKGKEKRILCVTVIVIVMQSAQ